LLGNQFFWLVDCAESSGSTLNSGIPVKKASLQRSDFVQQNEANYKLTNSLFGHSRTKITWPVKNTVPVQMKITPHILSQRDKGKKKQSNKKQTHKNYSP